MCNWCHVLGKAYGQVTILLVLFLIGQKSCTRFFSLNQKPVIAKLLLTMNGKLPQTIKDVNNLTAVLPVVQAINLDHIQMSQRKIQFVLKVEYKFIVTKNDKNMFILTLS